MLETHINSTPATDSPAIIKMDRLPSSVQRSDLRSYFSMFGPVWDCLLPRNNISGTSYGNATFKTTRVAANLILSKSHKLHGTRLFLEELILKPCKGAKQLSVPIIFGEGFKSKNVQEERVREYFEQHGHVSKLLLINGFYMVQYDNKQSAESLTSMPEHVFDGEQLAMFFNEYTTGEADLLATYITEINTLDTEPTKGQGGRPQAYELVDSVEELKRKLRETQFQRRSVAVSDKKVLKGVTFNFKTSRKLDCTQTT